MHPQQNEDDDQSIVRTIEQEQYYVWEGNLGRHMPRILQVRGSRMLRRLASPCRYISCICNTLLL